MSKEHEHRLYRFKGTAKGLIPFFAKVKESDLFILASKKLEDLAVNTLIELREEIESWIEKHPEFLSSYKPLDVVRGCPEIVDEMYRAGKICGVGPMAAVAGAISEFVGKRLLKNASEVIVENGGDIFAFTKKERKALVYAGNSPFSGKLAIKIPEGQEIGICTSSGTVGPSMSFGKADAVVAVAQKAAIADAAATAIGNLIRDRNDFEKATLRAKEMPLEGGVLIIGEHMAAWGNVELTVP